MEFFNRNDYKVLECLIVRDCNSPVASLTVKQIINLTELSQTKVRTVLNQFGLMKFLQAGSKDGNKNTYYYTNEGLEHFKKAFAFDDKAIEELKLNE